MLASLYMPTSMICSQCRSSVKCSDTGPDLQVRIELWTTMDTPQRDWLSYQDFRLTAVGTYILCLIPGRAIFWFL